MVVSRRRPVWGFLCTVSGSLLLPERTRPMIRRLVPLAVLGLLPASATALPCPPPGPPEDLAATQGPGRLSPEQRRLVTALAEHRLRGDVLLGATVPSSAAAARRLGWTPQKFNRTLDRVCHKLEQLGVRGLHGGPGELAANRRSRLVDYALTTGLVTAVDLACLPGEADHG